MKHFQLKHHRSLSFGNDRIFLPDKEADTSDIATHDISYIFLPENSNLLRLVANGKAINIKFSSAPVRQHFLECLRPETFMEREEKKVATSIAAFISVLPLSLVVVMSLKWQDLQQMRFAIEVLSTLVVLASVLVSYLLKRMQARRIVVYRSVRDV